MFVKLISSMAPSLFPDLSCTSFSRLPILPDNLKRQRGRRGLEVVERLQKMSWLDLRILDEDFPGSLAVDQKFVELARSSNSKIVTNDFNLNKVARVQGISILNVNELANAMKAAVLPGEAMRVLILREGKESTQGVAYLDDGTMVVVDGARRHINRTIDIVVTSTHQTPAGKMIFARVEERPDASSSRVAAGTGAAPATGPGAADLPIGSSYRANLQPPPATESLYHFRTTRRSPDRLFASRESPLRSTQKLSARFLFHPPLAVHSPFCNPRLSPQHSA